MIYVIALSKTIIISDFTSGYLTLIQQLERDPNFTSGFPAPKIDQ